MIKSQFLISSILLSLLLASCSQQKQQQSVKDLSWQAIRERARGQTVNMMMWQGDPNINRYMQQYVVPEVKERYGIDLEVAGGQGGTIVSILMTELEAGKEQSELDLVWINGENFYQLRRIDALHGPFVRQLPNSQYIDFDNPFIKYDFQQPIDGYECPWGNVQFTLIYDTPRVKQPPRTMDGLASYLKAHPGDFTWTTDFTGMTFLKSLLIAIADPGTLDGEFDKAKYEKYSAKLWDYVRRIRPYLWKQGETFPSGVAALHQLFVNGEVDFTMSNNDAEVENKMREGLFPKSARGYVLESGTIQNSHYLGIPRLSGHKAAAMAVANFLISPEAQYHKMLPKVWGDGTVLDVEKLSALWAEKFRTMPGRNHVPPRDSLDQHALRELAPEYMIRLYEDFRSEIIEE